MNWGSALPQKRTDAQQPGNVGRAECVVALSLPITLSSYEMGMVAPRQRLEPGPRMDLPWHGDRGSMLMYNGGWASDSVSLGSEQLARL